MSTMREEGSRVCAGAQTDKRTTPLAKLDLHLNGKVEEGIARKSIFTLTLNKKEVWVNISSLPSRSFSCSLLYFRANSGGINAGTPSINFPRNIFNFIKSFRPTAFSLTSCLRSGSVMRTKRPHGMNQGLQISFELKL